MPIRTVRARVHGNHLEPVEDLELVDGSEVTLTLEIPEGRKPRERVEFASRKLGVKMPITRDVIYEDIG